MQAGGFKIAQELFKGKDTLVSVPSKHKWLVLYWPGFLKRSLLQKDPLPRESICVRNLPAGEWLRAALECRLLRAPSPLWGVLPSWERPVLDVPLPCRHAPPRTPSEDILIAFVSFPSGDMSQSAGKVPAYTPSTPRLYFPSVRARPFSIFLLPPLFFGWNPKQSINSENLAFWLDLLQTGWPGASRLPSWYFFEYLENWGGAYFSCIQAFANPSVNQISTKHIWMLDPGLSIQETWLQRY